MDPPFATGLQSRGEGYSRGKPGRAPTLSALFDPNRVDRAHHAKYAGSGVDGERNNRNASVIIERQVGLYRVDKQEPSGVGARQQHPEPFEHSPDHLHHFTLSAHLLAPRRNVDVAKAYRSAFLTARSGPERALRPGLSKCARCMPETLHRDACCGRIDLSGQRLI
jgi:hypothetical protein